MKILLEGSVPMGGYDPDTALRVRIRDDKHNLIADGELTAKQIVRVLQGGSVELEVAVKGEAA